MTVHLNDGAVITGIDHIVPSVNGRGNVTFHFYSKGEEAAEPAGAQRVTAIFLGEDRQREDIPF